MNGNEAVKLRNLASVPGMDKLIGDLGIKELLGIAEKIDRRPSSCEAHANAICGANLIRV